VPTRLPKRLDLAPVELAGQLAVAAAAAPEPAGRSLVLVNRRTAEQYNSLHRQLIGRGRPAVPSLLVHPVDAAARGLASGDTATVSTDHGSCTAVVEVTDSIRAGVVSLPHGFDEANVNRLIPTTSADPLSGMTIVSGLPVDVRPAVPTP
jgi:anaerobic selenocysteine-containing dehydrogenase